MNPISRRTAILGLGAAAACAAVPAFADDAAIPHADTRTTGQKLRLAVEVYQNARSEVDFASGSWKQDGAAQRQLLASPSFVSVSGQKVTYRSGESISYISGTVMTDGSPAEHKTKQLETGFTMELTPRLIGTKVMLDLHAKNTDLKSMKNVMDGNGKDGDILVQVPDVVELEANGSAVIPLFKASTVDIGAFSIRVTPSLA